MPLSWSIRRQISILGSVIIFVLAVSFGFFTSSQAPSCADGKQNQDETGIDCGGACSAICLDSVRPLTILWSRALPAGNNIYDAAAFIENINIHAGISRLAYKFKLYDVNNLLVAERAGTTFVNPNERLIVFEGNIRVGNRVPKRAFIEFEKNPLWEEASQLPPPIDVRQTIIDTINGKTSLMATISNRSPDEMTDIVFTATLIDEEGNVFAASKTELGKLNGGEETTIFFTWPRVFEKTPSRIVVYPRVRIL